MREGADTGEGRGRAAQRDVRRYNIAVYDRAPFKLAAGSRRKLSACPELAPVLDRCRIAIL